MKSQFKIVVYMLIIGLLGLFGGVSFAKEKANLSAGERFVLDLENKKKGMSIFGVKPGAKLKEVQSIFNCTVTGSDYLTHKCESGGKEINVQAVKCGKEMCIGYVSGKIRFTKEQAETEINRITKLIGPPSVVHNDNRSWKKLSSYDRELIWGNKGWFHRYDIDPSDIFTIYLSVISDQEVELSKYYRNYFYYKEVLKFDWASIEGGIYYLLGWGALVGVGLFSFNVFEGQRRKSSREQGVIANIITFGFEWLYIASISGVVTFIIGLGGSVCEAQDVFGCTEYGEYVEPISLAGKIELFIKIFGAALLGWWFAVKNFRVERHS